MRNLAAKPSIETKPAEFQIAVQVVSKRGRVEQSPAKKMGDMRQVLLVTDLRRRHCQAAGVDDLAGPAVLF